jgi:hypothetical protein
MPREQDDFLRLLCAFEPVSLLVCESSVGYRGQQLNLQQHRLALEVVAYRLCFFRATRRVPGATVRCPRRCVNCASLFEVTRRGFTRFVATDRSQLARQLVVSDEHGELRGFSSYAELDAWYNRIRSAGRRGIQAWCDSGHVD